MSAKSKLKKSRDNWKKKTVERGNNERYQRKEKLRIRKERDKHKEEVRKLKKQLEEERRIRTAPQVHNKEELVYISLLLFFVARISFRAVSRVLGILSDYLGIKKAPCPQTIINWSIRLSIVRIRNSSQMVGPRIEKDLFSNGFIWMIDASIGLGSGKILALLALKADHHVLNKNAPTLKSVHCVAVSVASSWTGETVADFLQKVISVTGRPLAWLKDGGTDLAKAVRLLNERGLAGSSIDDISHVCANLLKHEYQSHPMFETFISACGRVSKKLKQTILACLAPPKVLTKVRFMNLHHLVKWADRLLRCSPRGRSSKGSLLSKLRAGFDRLPECRIFIKHFLRDAGALLECQKTLKTEGLNHVTYGECRKVVENLPPRSSVRKGFIVWMENQFKTATELGLEKSGMPISSDSIESLFGVSKQHGTGAIKDANRIALRIPTLCSHLTKEDAGQVLTISVKEQQEITGNLPSLIKQRREIFKNPECLEEILTNEKKQNIELIPDAEKRSKNTDKIIFPEYYKNTTGPPGDIQKQDTMYPDIYFPEVLTG